MAGFRPLFADSGCHGAPLLMLMQNTVTQNVGELSYAAALDLGHHGGRGKTAAAMVGGARFIQL
jgi:hypothetical protein